MEFSSASNTSDPRFTYKLTLQYLGTRYQGWQSQGERETGTGGVTTIQGELNRILAQMVKSPDVKTVGSGRTDAGVHAFAQVVKVVLPHEIPAEGLRKGLNALLPPDIKAIGCERVEGDFHPIYQAREKEYQYVFSTQELSPFALPLMAHYPFPVDVCAMKAAAQLFVGRHDFKDFHCVGTETSTTVREIYQCELLEGLSTGFWSNYAESYFLLRIVGEGFLKQMVRMIMGTIWNAGRGKCTLGQIQNALSAPTGRKLAPVAPPEGLYLHHVTY